MHLECGLTSQSSGRLPAHCVRLQPPLISNVSHHDMSLRAAVASALVFSLFFGIADTYFFARHAATSRPLDLLFSLVLLAIGYLWYRRDSDARSYRGSIFLGGTVILLPLVGLPIYLYLSRQPGTRSGALFRLAGLLLLCIACSAVAPLAYDVAGAG